MSSLFLPFLELNSTAACFTCHLPLITVARATRFGDALSRQFSTNTNQPELENLLPATCKVGSLTWDQEEALILGPVPQFSAKHKQLSVAFRLSSTIKKTIGRPFAPLSEPVGNCPSLCYTHNPATWSSQLSWTEYTYNSLPSSAIGLSPFEASPRYQPPPFPEMETDLAVPSVCPSPLCPSASNCQSSVPWVCFYVHFHISAFQPLTVRWLYGVWMVGWCHGWIIKYLLNWIVGWFDSITIGCLDIVMVGQLDDCLLDRWIEG